MAHLPTGLSNDSRDRQEERCPARVRVGSNENISRAVKFLCGKVMIPVLRSGKIMLPDAQIRAASKLSLFGEHPEFE
jgi:hypothetical protein